MRRVNRDSSRAKLSPKAQNDLENISNQIRADNLEAAQRVRQVILDSADLLAQHPELGIAFATLLLVMRKSVGSSCRNFAIA